MLCRSRSWMGCVGLAAAAEVREVTTGVDGVVGEGEAAEVAEGVMGVVGTWAEPSRLAAEVVVVVGVTAVEGLRREEKSGLVGCFSQNLFLVSENEVLI